MPGTAAAAAPRVRTGGVSHSGLIHFSQSGGKMAARWGTGEEMLTACKLEYFSPTFLDEVRLFILFASCLLL